MSQELNNLRQVRELLEKVLPFLQQYLERKAMEAVQREIEFLKSKNFAESVLYGVREFKVPLERALITSITTILRDLEECGLEVEFDIDNVVKVLRRMLGIER